MSTCAIRVRTDAPSSPGVRIGIVDLTPGPSRRAASDMFSDLIRAAAGDSLGATARTVRLGSPAPSRSAVRAALAGTDAVIVTGTEPAGRALADDPAARTVEAVLAATLEEGRRVFLSCFSAHAALGCLGGDRRRRLRDKHAGVFPHVVADPHHPLTADLPARHAMPHSRWNVVDQQVLVAAGLSPVIVEEDGQWSIAADPDARLVLAQGHPEYGADTLYREYRRDVRRYLAGRATAYPTLPEGYLDDRLGSALARFAARACRAPSPQLTDGFPAFDETAVRASWSPWSTVLMRNWLRLVVGTEAGR